MSYKKRIFIGSSTESAQLGSKIQSVLEKRGYDCRIWNGDFFEYGHSYMEDLIKKIISYDFAIMIGGPDDEVIRQSTGMHKIAPRDNVYLEYGLFSGVLSVYRTLLLKYTECTIASDLKGISLAEYSNEEDAVKQVEKWIEQRESGLSRSLGREQIELLPTVGIAVGYFENFLTKFMLKFADDKVAEKYGDIHLTVCIPSYLSQNADDYKFMLKQRYSLKDDSIEDFRIMYSKSAAPDLMMYDCPSTITAIYKTVDYIWGIEAGNTDDMARAKLRALDNFAYNLTTLISSVAWMRERIEVIRFDEN